MFFNVLPSSRCTPSYLSIIIIIIIIFCIVFISSIHSLTLSRLQDAPPPPPAPMLNTSTSADSSNASTKRRHRRPRCCCCCCCYSSQGDGDLESSSAVAMTSPGCSDLDIHGARYCLFRREHSTANCTFSMQRSVHRALLTYLLTNVPVHNSAFVPVL